LPWRVGGTVEGLYDGEVQVKALILRIFRRAPSHEERPYRKNLCCEYFGHLGEAVGFPAVGIIRVNLNYCPVCGRDLRVERKRPCDMRPRKG
jgi:hypothetical protein